MAAGIWILVTVIALFLILMAFIFHRKKKTRMNYYGFFVMGLIWLLIGIPLKNEGLMALGIIFSLVGMMNSDKWMEHWHGWHHLEKGDKLMRTFLLIVAGIISIGLILYIIFGPKV